MEGVRCLGSETVYGATDCLQSKAVDGTPPMQIFGGTHHCSQGGALLRRPIQGVQGSHSGKPVVSHHIQHGFGHGNLPLGNGGGQGGVHQKRVDLRSQYMQKIIK